MVTNDLLQHCANWKSIYTNPEVRRNPTRLTRCYMSRFAEFGRSGHNYTRNDVLELLSHEVSPGVIWSQDFTPGRNF